jgi:L-type amino acid transporter 5
MAAEATAQYKAVQNGDGVPDGEVEVKVELKKEISLLGGCAIIIGTIIGSGIFLNPSGVLMYSGSVGVALLVWVLCGLLSTLGALCYAELGTMISKSGGDYAYIKEAFGRLPSFLLAWVHLMIVRPVTHAVIAIIFSKNFLYPFFGTCEIPIVAERLTAALCILLLTFVNCYSVKAATRVQSIFMGAKLLALFVIIICGFIGIVFFDYTATFEAPFEGTTENPFDFVMAFYNGLFAFGGWNYLNFVTEELKDPYVNLPRAIIISLPLVTVVYLLANVAYMTAVSKAAFIASQTIALDFAQLYLGPVYPIMSLFIAFSCFGAVNGSLFTGARLFFVASREDQLPCFFQMISIHHLTPMPAIALCGVMSCAYLFSPDVFTLIAFFSFSTWLFIAAAVAGQVWIRIQKKDADFVKNRPLRIPLALPIIFLVCCLFLLIMSFVADTLNTVIGSLIILTGIPVWVLFVYLPQDKNIQPTFIKNISEWLTVTTQKLCVTLPNEEKKDI